MEIYILIGLSVAIIIIAMTVLAVTYFRRARSVQQYLWNTVGTDFRDEETGQIDSQKIMQVTGRAEPGKVKRQELEVKLFRAGYFAKKDRESYQRLRVISLIVGVIVLPTVLFAATGKALFVVLGLILGGFIGYAYPINKVEKAIAERSEETSMYLPLVIEQVSIGVSSSLDIGPSLSHITKLATERDSHNPVTEMLVHVEVLVRSGLNLEDALMEVAEANGIADIKHTFLFLAQCARHGGEITRQLQDLADAMTVQRQMKVEEMITALPVKATAPLGMVFAGFMIIILAGLAVRLGSGLMPYLG